MLAVSRADGLLRVGVLRRRSRTCSSSSRATRSGSPGSSPPRVALSMMAGNQIVAFASHYCGRRTTLLLGAAAISDVRGRRRRARGLVLGGARRAPRRHGVVGCHQPRSVRVPPSGRAVGATRHRRLLRLDGLECRRHRRTGRARRARRGAQRRLGVRRRWSGDGRGPAAARPAAPARRRPGRHRR